MTDDSIPGSDATPPLGYRRQDRFDTCGYNPTMREGDECGQPATWHIIWTPDCENGAACDGHMTAARERWAFYAAHRRGADCMMPGAYFIYDENRCVVDGEPIDGPVLNASAGARAGETR